MGTLDGKRIAILATDGFEQSELLQPREAIRREGGLPVVVSPTRDRIRAWDHDHWGDRVDVDLPLDQARVEDFDGLVLPGGVMNPDHLRTMEPVRRLVRGFFEEGKPVAAICHGPWILIDAGVVKGRRLTSYASLQTDLRNAGARWVDQEVVAEDGLITSRHPGDLPAFCRALIDAVAHGRTAAPA